MKTLPIRLQAEEKGIKQQIAIGICILITSYEMYVYDKRMYVYDKTNELQVNVTLQFLFISVPILQSITGLVLYILYTCMYVYMSYIRAASVKRKRFHSQPFHNHEKCKA